MPPPEKTMWIALLFITGVTSPEGLKGEGREEMGQIRHIFLTTPNLALPPSRRHELQRRGGQEQAHKAEAIQKRTTILFSGQPRNWK